MLIGNGDNTFTGGPLDVICVLQSPKGTFHAAFFEESPMPGPVVDVSEVEAVRLKSKMHHTGGRATFVEAVADVDDMASKIHLRPENVWRDKPQEWCGEPTVWIVANWLTVHR